MPGGVGGAELIGSPLSRLLSGEIRRIDQLNARRDVQAASATGHQQAPDAGLLARGDDRAATGDELLTDLRHAPTRVEGAYHHVMPIELFHYEAQLNYPSA